jgi:hypothetical protein
MTPLQRRNIKLYLQFRDQPMSILGLIWANRRMYLLLCFIFGVVAAVVYAFCGALVASFFGVAFVAVFVRDIGFYRRSIAIWPVLLQVLDWSKVEELERSDEIERSQRTP